MKKDTYVERIKQLRQEDGISQRELAKRVGVSSSAITYWEMGARVPNALAVIKLAEYFQVSSDYILGISDKID